MKTAKIQKNGGRPATVACAASTAGRKGDEPLQGPLGGGQGIAGDGAVSGELVHPEAPGLGRGEGWELANLAEGCDGVGSGLQGGRVRGQGNGRASAYGRRGWGEEGGVMG